MDQEWTTTATSREQSRDGKQVREFTVAHTVCSVTVQPASDPIPAVDSNHGTTQLAVGRRTNEKYEPSSRAAGAALVYGGKATRDDGEHTGNEPLTADLQQGLLELSRPPILLSVSTYSKSWLALPMLFCCIAACDAQPAAQDRQRFGFAVTTLQTGDGESAVCIGDFDEDDRLDIVIAAEDHDRLTLLRGDGAGGFSGKVTVAAGENPTFVAQGHLDDDTHLDLIVANHETDYLTFMSGDGAGGFSAPIGPRISVDVVPHPHVVRVADLNGDSKADLVVDSRDNAGVYALAGDGMGRFATPGTSIEVGGTPYLGFALGDLDGDGLPDLVTPNRDTVSVLHNASESKTGIAFHRRQRLSFPSPFAVELADLDGDGQLDLIVASETGTDNIGIFLGNASGEFKAEADTKLTVASGPKLLAVGDFDGDRRSDVVVTAWRSDIHIVSANDSGFMKTALPLGKLEAPWNTATGDLNGDGRADIVVTDGDGTVMNVYLSLGPARPAP